ncbi:MAG TPA: LysR substrate-binding domain-containing protein [Ramlibacter sp.]|nr:LysR substrate-binding domain-containing protein [Ramlibacter sp.]
MSESISAVRARRNLPSLVALRAFEAAAAHLSVQRAAAELHVTPTAVTHQVRALEQELGTALFLRKPRQLALTPAGLRLFETLRDGLDAIAAGVRAARQGTPHRVVTLSTTTAFAARWVLPRLGALHAACPGVVLRIHATEAVVDLARGDADLAIRFGDGQWPGLATQHLGEERYAVMCSPAVRLRSLQDLDKVPLVHFDWGSNARSPATWSNWAKKAGIPQPARWAAARPGLSFSDEAQAMSATLAGLGVGLLSLTLTEAERSSGMLLQPLAPVLGTGPFHLAAVQGHEDAPGIREVWKWIAQERAVP